MKTWSDKKGLRKYAHCKFDGHSIIIKKIAPKEVKYFTRNMREIDLSFLNCHRAISSRVPVGQVLKAELWKPDEPASYVTSGIAHKDNRMILSVFELVSMPTLMTLEEAWEISMQWGLPFIPWLLNADEPRAATGHPGCIGMFDCALPDIPLHMHCEGYVLKNSQGDPDPLKIKSERTCDLIVTGIVEGKGKFADMVGALVCSTIEGNELANISGFTDKERVEITELGDKVLGTVVEVKYQYVANAGRLRHPRFKRFRTDKPAQECTLGQFD